MLSISLGQYSDKGRKAVNQDFHGAYTPREPQLSAKGIAIALADGISSSEVSQIASESAVAGFLADYYCTSETWSVKKSVQQVLMATNSWLHAQTEQSQYRFDKDRGYVCTFSALVIKSTTAHIFHTGDARVYRLHANKLDQLTRDHRLWVSEEKSYLSRALGINAQLEIDYQSLPLETKDIFVLASDGVYEYVDEGFMAKVIAVHQSDLDKAAKRIVNEAYDKGSDDNLTVQIVRIENLPRQDANELYQQLTELPFPPVLGARMVFDGYKIIRELHASSRSHAYLAADSESDNLVVIKAPSVEMQQDLDHLERFLTEEWIARRINSPHVVKPCLQTRKRNHLYTVTEFIEGQTLSQWMVDNPQPELETVRGIVEQIAKGLRAFHRMEMLHQDIRPDNIMIDTSGTVKIIDFGSTRVAGLMDSSAPVNRNSILGTEQYAAPEYFLGEGGSWRSDIFSLGVIAYQMLTGTLPYGTQLPKCRTKADQHKLKYRSALDGNREIPAWVDGVLKKAVHPNPHKRYGELSEFTYDLRRPNKEFLNNIQPPLIERNPTLFWQGVSFLLAIVIVVLLIDGNH